MAARPRIECIPARDIEDFAHREAATFTSGAVVPISSSRARAWAANPYADPDDVVLIVARVEDRCVGYLGLLPGRVRVEDRVEPLSWLSTFFVPEAWRDQAIGGLLLMRALALGRTLAVTDPSPEAAQTFTAVGFAPLRSSTYLQLDVVRDRNWLGLPLRAVRRTVQRRGRPVPRRLDDAITGCARLTAAVLGRALLSVAQRRLGPTAARDLETLPPLTPAAGPEPRFVRDQALLEWMLRRPWVSTGGEGSNAAYYFDDVRRESIHRIVALGPGSGPTPPGWAILWFDAHEDRRRLQVLDCQLGAPAQAEALVVAVLALARDRRANDIRLPAACGPTLARLGPLGRLFAPVERRGYFRAHPSSLSPAILATVTMTYQDGDSAFA